MMIRIVIAAAVIGAASPAAAGGAGQSFDCAKARSASEKLLCGDTQLRELDEHLARYYSAARIELRSAASCLQSDQAQWLRSTRDACPDAACLKNAYLNRLAELDPLQPGATAIRTIELPPAPALMWVIGPASDAVAAPPNPKAVAFNETATILDEVSNGDGFMLQTADGAKLPLMMLMFLETESQERLATLAKAATPVYRVRGFVAADGKRRFIEPSRCTFIHRPPGAAQRPAMPSDLDDMEKVRARIVTQGKVCADPNRPCPGFNDNELSFSIAQPFKFDRGRDRSQPFYAVILRSGPLCGIAAADRLQAQKQFPSAKVFVHRYFCDDFQDNVTYTNINEKSGFIAVYAGETAAEARKVLAQANAAGYAGANLRRMAVTVVYQVE
jgi:uncharacterized protein